MGKLIYFLCFIDLLSIGLFMPIQSVHVISLGGTKLTAGFSSSMQSFLQLIFGPLFGSLSDSVGRKPLLILTTIGLILSNLFLSIQSLPLFFISRFILGVSSNTQILLKALVTDFHKPEEHAAIFGKIGAIFALSFIIGPVVSGHILEMENGFSYLIGILLSLNVLSLSIYFTMPVPKPKSENSKEKTSELKLNPFAKLLQLDWAIFFNIFLLKFLFDCSSAIFFQSFGVVMNEVYKTPRKQLGYIIASISLTMIVVNLSLNKIMVKMYGPENKNEKKMMHGIIGLAVIYVIVYSLPSFWVYFGSMFVIVVFKTLLDATCMETVVQKSNDGNKGTVMGGFESMPQLSGLISPLIGGYISTNYGYTATSITCLIPLIISAVVLKTTKNKIVKLD